MTAWEMEVSVGLLKWRFQRSAACGGDVDGALELPKRANDRRGWVWLHAALGADRDKMNPFERQWGCDQVAALGNVEPF